jgi:hypothetical protein
MVYLSVAQRTLLHLVDLLHLVHGLDLGVSPSPPKLERNAVLEFVASPPSRAGTPDSSITSSAEMKVGWLGMVGEVAELVAGR